MCHIIERILKDQHEDCKAETSNWRGHKAKHKNLLVPSIHCIKGVLHALDHVPNYPHIETVEDEKKNLGEDEVRTVQLLKVFVLLVAFEIKKRRLVHFYIWNIEQPVAFSPYVVL